MIGTTAAIALGLGSIGASAATNLYSAHAAADVNDKSISAQREQASADAQIAREQLAAQERARQDQLALDRQRWDDYVRINTPYWQTGQQVYGSLLDLANRRPGGGGSTGRTLPPMPVTPAGGPPMTPPPTRSAPALGATSPHVNRSVVGSGATTGRRGAAVPMPSPAPSNMATLLDLALRYGDRQAPLRGATSMGTLMNGQRLLGL